MAPHALHVPAYVSTKGQDLLYALIQTLHSTIPCRSQPNHLNLLGPSMIRLNTFGTAGSELQAPPHKHPLLAASQTPIAARHTSNITHWQ